MALNSRSIGRAFAILLAAILPLGFAPAAYAQSARAENYAFAFQDAEIGRVVQEVLGQAGIAYAMDPGITGKLTFRIEQRLTRDQLVAALETVLSANGVAVVRNGGQLVITPEAKAKTSARIREGAAGAGAAGYEVVAIPLAYAQPSEVGKAVEAITGASTVLYANDKLGLLVVGGAGPQLRAALDALRVFDQNAFQESKIRWFELSQAQATTVAAELDRIVQGAGLVGVAVVPLKRLNGVIIFGRSQSSLDELSKWIARLDTPEAAIDSSLWVYRPRNAAAEALAQTLNSVLGFQTRTDSNSSLGSRPSAPSLAPPPESAASTTTISLGSGEDEVRIGVDKDSNALLVLASASRWVQIQRILGQIDRPVRQVLIEASILEVSLGKEFQFGLDWEAFNEHVTATSINNRTGVIGASFPGLSVAYFNKDIEAVVKTLGSRTSVEVISAPKIIALDNRTARLQIGDQVPIVTQSAQSADDRNAPLISTIDYRNTGVILNVTPRITGEDQLVLDVAQEVSSVARTLSSGIDSPTIQQRRFESSLVVRDGGVVALGGLISSNRTNSRSGVPGLMNLPAVGALFRTEGRSQTRSELIVLLRARIISDQAGADRAMVDLAADMRELRGHGLLPFAR